MASQKQSPIRCRKSQTEKNILLIIAVRALMKSSVRCTRERKHFIGQSSFPGAIADTPPFESIRLILYVYNPPHYVLLESVCPQELKVW